MKNITITSFEIEGLYGDRNVILTFDENIRILVGENGSGKTTILTILYLVLSRKFHSLYNIDFTRIHLNLSSNETITFEKEWLSLEQNKQAYKYFKVLEDKLSQDELELALDVAYGNRTIEEFIRKYRLRDQEGPSFGPIRRYIVELKHHLADKGSYLYAEKLLTIDNKIKQIFPQEILYFPTYRRIEDELQKLGLRSINDDLSKKKGTINFGMNDVQEAFNNIKNEIKDESLTSYSNVTGNMIKHLIYPLSIDIKLNNENNYLKDINLQLLGIVLDRFGKDLNKEDKNYIFGLIDNNKIFNEENYSLNFYLNNLIENYMLYKERDDSIKEFARIASKYLVNKEVDFNESTGEISIINLKNHKKIELNHLSSGEKQIVAILTQIFLNFKSDFIILFDEPELSLSIEWQEMLLPDIIDSGKCSLLFAVTHSPFIFDNSLDKYARGIEMFIEETFIDNE